MEPTTMKQIKFKRSLLALTMMLGLMPLATFAEEPSPQSQPALRPDIDIRFPRVPIKSPIAAPTYKIYETLPSRMFFSGSVESSYRMETNPYQAPLAYHSFIDNRGALRRQADATLGYALGQKDRVSLGYFMLSNNYDNFTPYRLDSTSHSLSLTYEHDFYQGQHWSVRSAMVGRQVFTPNGSVSGDLMPSVTVMRRLGTNGWSYGNGALNLSRSDFFIGDVSSLTPILSVGLGYQVPYDSEKLWQKMLQGLTMSLSSTYSFATNYDASLGSPRNYQNLIITGELSRAIRRKWPLVAFVRGEPVFNFGQNRDAFGLSGINFRLFGGLRYSFSKSPVFTTDLASTNNNAEGK
jgi:hypothetical protein